MGRGPFKAMEKDVALVLFFCQSLLQMLSSCHHCSSSLEKQVIWVPVVFSWSHVPPGDVWYLMWYRIACHFLLIAELSGRKRLRRKLSQPVFAHAQRPYSIQGLLTGPAECKENALTVNGLCHFSFLAQHAAKASRHRFHVIGNFHYLDISLVISILQQLNGKIC